MSIREHRLSSDAQRSRRAVVGYGANRPARVVIVGSGVAALEAMLALVSRVPGRAAITIVAPERPFVYHPLSTCAVLGGAPPSIPLDDLVRTYGIARVPDRAAAIDTARRRVRTEGGADLQYDALIVATGAPRRRARPGALTLGDPADVPAVQRLLHKLASGAVHSVAFAVPNRWAWALPVYEVALLAAAHVERAGGDAQLTIVTPERDPLELLGSRASRAVARLLAERGVGFRGFTFPLSHEHGVLLTAPGGPVPADAVISAAEVEAATLPGLPAGRRGFVSTDEFGRVDGRDDLFVVGEASAYPIRQGGLAAQQAEAAASAIAASIDPGLQALRFTPVLRAALITGAEPLYVRTELHGARREELATGALWAPPGKIAARHLGALLDSYGVGRLPA